MSFRQWHELKERIALIPGIERAISVSDIYTLEKDDSLKRFRSQALMETIPETQQELDTFRKAVFDLPFYKNILINEDGDISLLLAQIEKDKLYKEDILIIVDTIKDILKKFEKDSGYEIHVTGLPYIRMANVTKIKREINQLIVLALAVTALLLFFFLKSVKATLIAMFVVVSGVVWSLGIIVLLNYEITMLSALIPPLIIVIGVPNAIFLINKYHNEYRIHGNKIKALSRMIRKIGNATFMTNATTASGFATFILTESTILKEFGVSAAFNIMVVFLLSLLLIPILYSFAAHPKERHYRHLEKKWIRNTVNWMVRMVSKKRRIVYIVTAITIILSAIGISMMYTTGNLSDDFAKQDPVLIDLRFFEKHFKGFVPLDIVIDTRKKEGALKLSNLKKLDKLEQKLQGFDELSRPLSILSLVKFSKQAFYNGHPDFYTLPNSQDKNSILKYARKFEGDANMLSTLMDSTRQRVRISMQVADLSTKEMRNLQDSLRATAQSIFNPDKYGIQITGSSVLFLKSTTYLIKSLFTSLFLAIVVISLFMAWMFRSPKMVLVSLIPNLIPLLFTAALMGYMGIPIKPSTILVFSIAFGISVDDTIHYLAKYRQELGARKWSIGPSVIAALKETGVSMIYTSIVLFFGFSIFTASEFGGTVALGLLVSITLLVAMLANLILLPSLLLSLERRITTEAFKEPMIDLLDEEEDIELDALYVKKKNPIKN